MGGDLIAQPAEQEGDGLHHRLGPGEHRLEHEEQDGQENGHAGHRVQQHIVQAAGPGVRAGRRLDTGPEDAVSLSLQTADVAKVRLVPVVAGVGRRWGRQGVDLVEQGLHPMPARGHTT